MEKCLHCSKELKHVPGRKQKSFCNVNCRNKYFYAKRKREVEVAKTALLATTRNPQNGFLENVLAVNPITPIQAVALHNAENKDQFTQAHILSKKQADEVFGPNRGLPDIQKQIDEIKAEKIPKERDTPMGRKAWEMDKQKRIQELKNQLK